MNFKPQRGHPFWLNNVFDSKLHMFNPHMKHAPTLNQTRIWNMKCHLAPLPT